MKILIIITCFYWLFPVKYDKRCTYEDINSKQCKKASILKSEYCKKHWHKY